MMMLDWYVNDLGDPCPEMPVVTTARYDERVCFVGTVRDWVRPLLLARLTRLRYEPDLSVDQCDDIRVYLRDMEAAS